MNEVAVYIVVGAGAVMLALSLPSLYLRSRYFFWIIIVAGWVGAIASVWAVASADTVYWYKAFLYGGGYLLFLRTVWKKYSKRQNFFGTARRAD